MVDVDNAIPYCIALLSTLVHVCRFVVVVWWWWWWRCRWRRIRLLLDEETVRGSFDRKWRRLLFEKKN